MASGSRWGSTYCHSTHVCKRSTRPSVVPLATARSRWSTRPSRKRIRAPTPESCSGRATRYLSPSHVLLTQLVKGYSRAMMPNGTYILLSVYITYFSFPRSSKPPPLPKTYQPVMEPLDEPANVFALLHEAKGRTYDNTPRSVPS